MNVQPIVLLVVGTVLVLIAPALILSPEVAAFYREMRSKIFRR